MMKVSTMRGTLLRRETMPLSIIVNDGAQAFTVDVTPIFRHRPI